MADRYGWMMDRWGYTPQEIDEMPLWVYRLAPVYAATVDEAKATLQRQAEEDAERRSRR